MFATFEDACGEDASPTPRHLERPAAIPRCRPQNLGKTGTTSKVRFAKLGAGRWRSPIARQSSPTLGQLAGRTLAVSARTTQGGCHEKYRINKLTAVVGNPLLVAAKAGTWHCRGVNCPSSTAAGMHRNAMQRALDCFALLAMTKPWISACAAMTGPSRFRNDAKASSQCRGHRRRHQPPILWVSRPFWRSGAKRRGAAASRLISGQRPHDVQCRRLRVPSRHAE